MSEDIVARLRTKVDALNDLAHRQDKIGWLASAGETRSVGLLVAEAADEIERLRAEQEARDLGDWCVDIQMIQNVADPEGAFAANWPDEFRAWYKPEQWMGVHRGACVFIGNKLRAALSEAGQQS